MCALVTGVQTCARPIYFRSPFSHVVESVCVRMRIPPIRLPVLITLAMAIPTRPVDPSSLLDYVGQCVPFARAASGIQIYGDAWTWWGQAEDRYQDRKSVV